MNALTNLFALTGILAGALCAITVWSPRLLWAKIAALATAALCLPLAYAAFAALLSQPKPVELEWWHRHAEEATVLGWVAEEDVGIHVWLQLPGQASPGAYTLPWSTALAEQLQRAQREAEGQDGGIRLRLPFERSWDDKEPRAYALPQPALPPKDMTDPPPPMEYVPPGTDA